MANGHGGPRTPSNPAPVSGPGAMSQRTDGQPITYIPGGEYGEGQELIDLQRGAPLAEASSPTAGADYQPQGPAVTPVPLGAGTAYPDEPITAGVDVGAGPGSEVMGLPNQDRDWVAQLAPYLPALEFAAGRPSASPIMRRAVRTIKLAMP
jgi:hypothetical protein